MLFPGRSSNKKGPEDAWDDGGEEFGQSSTPDPLPLLTPLHAQNVRFHTSKPGYAFAQVEAFVQQVASTLLALEGEAATSDAVLREAHEEMAHLRDQVIDLQNTIEVFRAKGDVLVGSDGTYVTESQLADVASLTAERDSLSAQVQEWAEAYQSLESHYQALEAQYAALVSSRSTEQETESDDSEILRQRDAAEAANSELEAAVDALRSEIAESASALSEARAHIARLEAEVEARDATLSVEATQALNETAASLQASQAELAQVREDLTRTQADTDTLRAELAAAQAELAQGQSLVDSESEVAALREALAATIIERDEALLAESELRAYVDETLAEWMQQSGHEQSTPAVGSETFVAEVTADPAVTEEGSGVLTSAEDDDEGWGDAPVAGAPETTGAIPLAGRQHAPLVDAPELRRQH